HGGRGCPAGLRHGRLSAATRRPAQRLADPGTPVGLRGSCVWPGDLLTGDGRPACLDFGPSRLDPRILGAGRHFRCDPVVRLRPIAVDPEGDPPTVFGLQAARADSRSPAPDRDRGRGCFGNGLSLSWLRRAISTARAYLGAGAFAAVTGE